CMTESYEFGLHKGLNIIAGSVRKFSEPISQDKFYKVPHVGWNRLLVPKRDKEGCSCEVSTMWENTILSKVRSGEWVYFVHSYTVVPEEMAVIMSETEYGGISFCSAIHRDNIFGCQFHPEVSGETGLKILKEFLYAM
ncbi:MAG: imidazole glycerol phosphate synthase subunit HisH, partial [bacterium]